MDSWLDIEPVGKWNRTEERYNAVKFEHEETEDELLLLRLIGSVPRNSRIDASNHDDRSFVIRYFPSNEPDEWDNIATLDEKSVAKEELLNTMQKLAPEHSFE